ncbi:MAG: WD40/YVTN/BNR-like repeat-containing protein [Paracoccaceae bacterium]
MIRTLIVAVALPMAAQAEETLPLAELLSNTHIHGIAAGLSGPNSAMLATHHGIFTIDLAAKTALLQGSSRDDFMGFSQVPGAPDRAFASGHPATGGNLGVIRTEDGGASWVAVSDGIGGPVDFHNMEVSRADAAVIFGISHDGAVQRSTDFGETWAITGTAPEKLIDVATSARDPNRLYAATESGLFASSDAGVTWQRLLPTTAPVSTVDLGADGKLRAVQLGQGLIEVDEATGSVTPVTADLPGGYLLYLAVTQANPLRLMALSAEGALVVSDDGGTLWRAAVE